MFFIINATKEIFAQSRYRSWFVVLSVLIFALYILLPVWLIPGNDPLFQLSILRLQDFILFAILSFMTALLILMQIFLTQRSKKERAGAIGRGSVGVSSSLFGGLLATAACPGCITTLLGFLGAGSVFFVIENQLYFLVGAIVLTIAAIYFTARRVGKYCPSCEV